MLAVVFPRFGSKPDVEMKFPWKRNQEKLNGDVKQVGEPELEYQHEEDQLAAQRRARAELDGTAPPSPPNVADTDSTRAILDARKRLAEHNAIVEVLGGKLSAVIKEYPYPPDTVVYVLEMLKANVVKQMQG